MTTPPKWTRPEHPATPHTTRCGFCGHTLTIDLADGGPSTITSGHAPDCVQNPNRARQGSAA